MSEKVELVGVTKEHGRYIYFVDEDGDVARVRSADSRGGVPEKVARTGVKKELGYLYYVDEDGDVSRAWLGAGRRSGR